MVRNAYLWGFFSLVLFLAAPLFSLCRAVGEIARFAWDIAFTPLAEYWRPPLDAAPDIWPLQRVRARSFSQRRLARIDRFTAAGCPRLSAA